MYTYISPSGHLFRKDKATVNCCPTVAPQSLHSCPPSLLHFVQMINPELHSVLHIEYSLVYCTLTTRPHRLWPPSQCFVCSVGLRQPPPLHPSVAWVSLSPACHCHRSRLRIPMHCCRWRTPWCWAGRRQLSGGEGLHLGQTRRGQRWQWSPGLNSGGFYLINSYRHCTLFPQVRHRG